MASPKTLAQQRSKPSAYARRHDLSTPLTPEERRAILAIPPGQRKVLAAWRSADGKTLYASDGISIRRMA